MRIIIESRFTTGIGQPVVLGKAQISLPHIFGDSKEESGAATAGRRRKKSTSSQHTGRKRSEVKK